jgi:hypothetical protein
LTRGGVFILSSSAAWASVVAQIVEGREKRGIFLSELSA